MERHYNVLFLCTGNSARSIMAEAILNLKGQPNFTGYSAGSHPSGRVRPEALRQLEKAHIPISGLRSKAWDEFSLPDSARLDFVFTVCDNAAGEACPVWPGHPMTVHWGIDDPAAAQGSDAQQRLAFRKAFEELERRIRAFIQLPVESLDPRELKQRLEAIGKSRTTEAA